MIENIRKRYRLFVSTYRKQLHITLFILSLFITLLSIQAVLTVDLTSNDECLWIPEQYKGERVVLRFSDVKQGGVTYHAGIRNDDLLLKIDGVAVRGSIQAQRLINKVEDGGVSVYTVMRKDSVFQTTVKIKKLINIGNLSLTVFTLFWLLVSFPVLRVRPEGVLQNNFFAVGVALSVFVSYIIVKPFTAQLSGNWIFWLYCFIWAVLNGFLALWYSMFFFRFPSGDATISKRVIRTMQFVSGLFVGAFFIPIAINIFTGNANLGVTAQFDPSVGGFIVILSAGFYFITRTYRLSKNTPMQKQLKIVVITYGFALLGLFFSSYVAPSFLGSVYNYPILYTPTFAFAFLPIALGYSIFRYQMFDIENAVRNTLIYGSATITLATAYLLTVYGIGQILGELVPEVYRTLVALFSFILFALLFDSSKEKIQNLLTNKIYPQRRAYERVLLELNTTLASLTGKEAILEEIGSLFVNVFSFKEVALASYSNGKATVIHSRNVSIAQPLYVNHHSLTTLLEYKLVTRTPLIIETEQFAEVFPQSSELLKSSLIYRVLPLAVAGKIAGFILLGLTDEGTLPGHKETEVLTALAAQIALALENARLYEEEKTKDAIEKELELAKKIQQNLLPANAPGILNLDICGAMVPAKQVGGDYFDFIPLGNDRMFAVIGDVSGKGLPASLYMSKIQTLVQVVCNASLGTADILKQINSKIYSGLERNSFITMSLAKIDGAGRTIQFSRAGHLPLLLVRGNETMFYKPSGIGLGLNKGTIFNTSIGEEEISLAPGDILLFYTDGINECQNSSEEFFGENRLSALLNNHRLLTAAEIVGELWKELTHFRGSAEQHDDMTAVVIKVL